MVSVTTGSWPVRKRIGIVEVCEACNANRAHPPTRAYLASAYALNGEIERGSAEARRSPEAERRRSLFEHRPDAGRRIPWNAKDPCLSPACARPACRRNDRSVLAQRRGRGRRRLHSRSSGVGQDLIPLAERCARGMREAIAALETVR